MKYEKDTIEFTSSKECFSGNFLKNGTMYHECDVGLLNGLINYTKVIDAYICKRYFDIECDKEDLVTNIRELVWDKILHNLQDKGIILAETTLISNSNEEVNIRLENLEDWIAVRRENNEFHTKIAIVDEELILTKVKDMENTYAFFWFSRTRNNSIMRFKTKDDIDMVKNEFLNYVNNCEFEQVYTIPASSYNGWLKSVR